MSGIKHLQEIYQKKGKEFVEKLFNKFVIIQEKIDLSRFAFQKESNGEFIYYKRDNSKPIDKIDRTLMCFYEPAINYIENLPSEIKEQIPIGMRFGTEFGIRTKSHEIEYDRLPKNNLILSDILTPEKTLIQNKEDLDKWADLLCIQRSPIIFEGTLSDEQKLKITDFLNTPFDDLVEHFKTTSFVRFILSILNPDLKETALNNDNEKPIEGLVFRFGEGDKGILAKLVDPIFTEIAKEKNSKKVEKTIQPNDIYNITLADLTAFVNNLNLNKLKPKGSDASEKYIDLMCNIFNLFIEQDGLKYKGLDFSEPDFLKKDEFKLNYEFIDNDKTRHFINLHPSYESLFRIMLNAFRKKKTSRSVNDLFTQEILDEFNEIVDKIENYLNTGLFESEFLTFAEFKLSQNPIKFTTEEEEQQEEEFQDVDALQQLKDDSISNKEEKKKEDSAKKSLLIDKYFISNEDSIDRELRGSNECNIFIGRFQPFHNGHLKTIQKVKESNNLPTVLVCIYTGQQTEKNVLSKELLENILKRLKEDKVIDDFIITDSAFFGNILKKLRPKGYEPVVYMCGEDRIKSYTKQLVYMRKNCKHMNIHPDSKVEQVDRISSATSVRDVIKTEDYQEFKKMVPPSLINFWEPLKVEVNKNNNF